MLQYHFNWKTISIVAGMTFWNFYFRIFDKAVGKEETVVFLSDLLQYLRRPLLVVWDRLPAHRSKLVGIPRFCAGWDCGGVPSALRPRTQPG